MDQLCFKPIIITIMQYLSGGLTQMLGHLSSEAVAGMVVGWRVCAFKSIVSRSRTSQRSSEQVNEGWRCEESPATQSFVSLTAHCRCQHRAPREAPNERLVPIFICIFVHPGGACAPVGKREDTWQAWSYQIWFVPHKVAHLATWGRVSQKFVTFFSVQAV